MLCESLNCIKTMNDAVKLDDEKTVGVQLYDMIQYDIKYYWMLCVSDTL